MHRLDQDPLAIVGMAVRLPGAPSLDAYWQLLRDGRSAIAPLPASRLDRALYFQPGDAVSGKTYTELGGTVPDEDLDPSLLGLDDDELASADRAHLWFLDTVLAALRGAAIEPDALAGQRVGVYVGHARGSTLVSDIGFAASIESMTAAIEQDPAYRSLPEPLKRELAQALVDGTRGRYPRIRPDGGPFTQPNAAAGWIARHLRTDGPYMAVDAACASSFAALDLAARAIHRGEIERAIVGGCSYNQWSSLVLFSQAQALSRTGSFPFDARADGFVSSDGYAALLVERLADARAAGHEVLGVIRGIGGSCDGRGKSLWAPLQAGQVEAIRRAYHEGLSPADVQVVEAHATGTQVGDATEIRALTEAFAALGGTGGAPRPIGSAKSNVGHTRETAGFAALVKVLLAMREGTVPATANLQNLTPEVAWDEVPFRPLKAAEPWPDRDGEPRRAAVDAFGIGGLNYHVVVERPLDQSAAAPRKARKGGKTAAAKRASALAHTARADTPPIPLAPVVVLGVGLVLPETFAIERFAALGDGRLPFAAPDAARWDSDLYVSADGAPYRIRDARAGWVRGWQLDWRTFKIPPRQLEQADPLQFMLLDSVAQALRLAGLDPLADDDRKRTAVYVGSVFGGDFTGDLNLGLRAPELVRQLERELDARGIGGDQRGAILAASATRLRERFPIADEAGSFSSSTLASRISKHFDFMGPCAAMDAEEASGLASLGAGLDALRAGECEIAVCCGAQRTLHHTRFEQYDRMGRLAHAGGGDFHLGEGAVAVVLTRADSALARGRTPFATFGDVTASSSRGGALDALRRAVTRAVGRASDEPRPAVLARFAPSASADAATESELHAATPDEAAPLALSAADRVGMTQGASALVSLVDALGVAGRRADELGASAAGGTVPVALHGVGLRGLAYHARLDAVPEAWRGLANAAAATAGSPASVAVAAAAAGPRIVRLGATSRDALAARIQGVLADVGAAWELAGRGGRFADHETWRLAVVAADPEALRAKLGSVRGAPDSLALSAALHEQGVFLMQRPATPPGLAFAFSGQGSQYGGMLRGLVDAYPVTRATLEEIDRELAALGEPSFADIAWSEEGAERLGADTWRTQISVFCADLLVHRVIASLGLAPSVVLGHSYGEYPAMVATGAWSLATGMRATHGRCKALDALGAPRGKLVSTSASSEQIAAVVARFAGRGFVAPANFNSPEQTVLAVETALVQEVADAIEATGEVARVLPVPQPFHSALLADAKPELARVLEACEIRPPRTPLLSGIGNEYVAEPSVIRARLTDQLTEPLRFVEMVRRAHADGARVFVEIGPRTVLTRLIRSILASEPVAVVCCDHPKVPAREQMLRVQALLETQDLWRAASVGSGAEPTAQASASVVWPYARTRELPAPAAVAIPHFDATQRRRAKVAERSDTLRGSAGATAPATGDEPSAAPTATAPTSANSEIEALLVKFVCDQTGYPPEVVTLDQDLEADLGIDSIKKARLLGELRDQFHIKLPAGGGGASLAQFVTLRDIAKFLAEKALMPSAGAGAAAASASTPTASIDAARHGAQPTRGGAAKLARELVLGLAGTDREMGRRHGERFASAIHGTLRRFQELLGVTSASELPMAREALGQQAAYYDEAALEEMRGIAEGAGVAAESIVALNLAMEPQFDAAGCTQLAATSAANGGQALLHAANEDSPAGLRLGNEMVRSVLVRRPAAANTAGGVRHACAILGVAGQVGGINGTNERGLTVSSTMLLDRPRDLSALGRVHPLLVLRVLEGAASLEEAIAIVEGWPRVGAWSLLISDSARDEIAYLEYDGPTLAVRRGVERILTTNHSQLLSGGDDVPDHSQHRLRRAEALLPEGALTAAAARALLRDRFDLARGREVRHPTMNTVCRVDNQASFVRVIGGGEDSFAVTPGPRHGADAELFLAFEPPRWWREDVADGTAAERAGRLMRRWVLRSVPAAPDTRRRGAPAALETWVIGADAIASAVAQSLAEAGSKVREIHDPATAELGGGAAPRRVVWVVPPEPVDDWTSPDPEVRRARVERHALAPFVLVQRWTNELRARDALAGAELIGVTRLGGDLGFGTARELDPAGGALTGLWKALRRELSGLRLKIVDGSGADPAPVVAQSVLHAIAGDDGRVETAWVRGRHQHLEMVPRELPEGGASTPPAGGAPSGAWIVTGGGRGVTAHVARAIGARFGVQLHLLGSTALEPIPDEWLTLDAAGKRELRQRTLAEARGRGDDPERAWSTIERRIELHATLAGHRAAGLAATYHAVDVGDAAALARVLDAVRADGTPVRGILHGAGIEAASDFAKKTLAQVRATVESKVLGLQHLLALTAGDELEHVIAFGSVSGRFGGMGQADYSLASDLLAKLVTAYRRRTGVPACTFHWPAWDDVGMAVRPESRFALEASGQVFMPVAEGCGHVLREIAAGLPENEVVILDRPAILDLDHLAPAEDVDRLLDGAVAHAQRSALVDGLVDDQDGIRIADATYDPARDLFLVDHCFEGQPILPAVVGLETLAEAALLGRDPGAAVLIENATIESGLRFRNRAPQRLRVEVVEHGAERWRATLRGDFISRVGKLGEPDRLYQRADVGLAGAVTRPADLAAPPADLEWWDMSYPPSAAEAEPGRVYHGPALRTLRRVSVRGEQAWGELVAPAPTALRPGRAAARWRMPSALLDGCLVVCGVYARIALSLPSLPNGFARLVALGIPEENEPCVAAARFRERAEGRLFFDFQLRSAAGRLLAWAEGYRVEVLDTEGGGGRS